MIPLYQEGWRAAPGCVRACNGFAIPTKLCMDYKSTIKDHYILQICDEKKISGFNLPYRDGYKQEDQPRCSSHG